MRAVLGSALGAERELLRVASGLVRSGLGGRSRHLGRRATFGEIADAALATRASARLR